jgi:hypothetical protein
MTTRHLDEALATFDQDDEHFRTSEMPSYHVGTARGPQAVA